MSYAPVKSISIAELQLSSLTIISLWKTEIEYLNLRGCPMLKDVYGANETGRDVLTAEGVKR